MGERTFKHAFDGYAKLCSWDFKTNGDTFFTSRFLKTHFFTASKRAHNVAPYLLFESAEPPFSMWEKMQALFHGIDNTNINIHRFKKRKPHWTGVEYDYVAMSDFWQSYSFNKTTLRTRGRISPYVPGGTPYGQTLPLPSSAHPLPEYGTDNFISYVSIMNPVPTAENSIRVIRILSAKFRRMIAKIKVKQVPYMHSFGLSKNYAIIFAAPLYVNVKTMLKTAEPVNSLDWFPDEPMKVYVVNIHTKKVTTLETGAVFPMHHVNAFEVDNDTIHVDAVTYPNLDFLHALELKKLSNRTARNQVHVNSEIMRFSIDLANRSVTPIHFPRTPNHHFVNVMDMPAINENYRHRQYCYVYGVALKSDGINLANTTLVKKNVCEEGKDVAWYQINHYPSEPWFLPEPGASEEDSGILLSLVLDGEKKTSYLGIWNARTMTLISQSYLPKHVPFTLHGQFFPNS